MSPVGVAPNTPGPGGVPGFWPEIQAGGFTTAQDLGFGAIGGSLISIAATPNAAAVGDFVLVAFAWAVATTALSTVTDTSGNTWTVVSAPAASNESGGYGYTTVTTGWATGANTVTGTLASGAPGGRVWAAVSIPAAYSPLVDQHNESTQTSGSPSFTTTNPLATVTEEVIIVDLLRTSPSGAPVWYWKNGFTRRNGINGSGTPGSGIGIGSIINEVGQAAVTGGFQGLNAADTHGGGIIAVKVMLQPNPLAAALAQVVGSGARATASRYNSQRRGLVLAAPVQLAAASAPAGPTVTPLPVTAVVHTSSRESLQGRTRDSNVYQPRSAADGVVVTPPRALVISPSVQTGERRAPDRRASITQNRWPGYQWAGLPSVTPLIEPRTATLAAQTAERRSPQRHTSVIQTRWPGYQWVGLPAIVPLTKTIVEDISALWQAVRGHRRSEVIAAPVQLAAATAGVIPPTITPTKSVVVGQAVQRAQCEQNRERRSHVVANRWPGYQWAALPPVVPVPHGTVQDQAAFWRNPQQHRGRVIQGRAAMVPTVVPARPNVIHISTPRRWRRGGVQWSQRQRFVPTGVTPTLITTPATGYVSAGDTGIPVSGSSGKPGAGDTGTVKAGLTGQVRI